MGKILIFLIGFIIGGFVGTMTVALAVASKDVEVR